MVRKIGIEDASDYLVPLKKELSEASLLQSLEEQDASGDALVSGIGEKTEAVAALEAISHALVRESGMNKLAARFANIAIEELCEGAGLEMDCAALDVVQVEQDQAKAVEAGVAAIGEITEGAMTAVVEDFTSILKSLTEKRDVFNSAMRQMYHRIDEVYEDLSKLKGMESTPMPREESFLGGVEFNAISYRGRGVVVRGCTVVSDLQHLLTEHSHLYKSLIKKQLDWINAHKDNILKDESGFNQYSFNPVEYRAAGSEVQELSELTANYVGPDLPGGVRFHTETTRDVCFGYEAIDALTHSKSYLQSAVEMEGAATGEQAVVPTLSLAEIEARLAEVKAGLEATRRWCDTGYAKLWKDAFFEEQVLAFLTQKEALNLNQRGLSMVAYAILSLLHNATKDMAQYSLTTLSGLLHYAEVSMTQYVLEHKDA